MRKITTSIVAAIGLVCLASGPAISATIIVDPATDDLKTFVEGATSTDILELKKGVHVATGTIAIPGGVTITADPAAPHGSVVVQGGNNSAPGDGRNLFTSFFTGLDIEISGLRFKPAADATLGGRAVYVVFFPSGSGDFIKFNNNIVERYSDAVFVQGATVGTFEFLNNDITIVDRDPNNLQPCNTDVPPNCLGGNAALTVLTSDVDSLEANGNKIQGPGRNVNRFLAVVGIITFADVELIDNVNIWNNAIKNFDTGIFMSGQTGENGASISENRLNTNGNGITVGQVPDPDITFPTPANDTNIIGNRITGNNVGVRIAENAKNTVLERNQIAGNSVAPIIDEANPGPTTVGDNLIRGKNTGEFSPNPPVAPPGQQFDPVTGGP